MANASELLKKLAEPFPPDAISWLPGSTTKDGNKCMAMAYADLRAYMHRLDEVCGLDWAVHYAPWEQGRIICELTLYVGDALGRREDITRSSTGEYSAQDEKNNIEGTVAEAQAFKRAAAMFGLGRYLYDLPSVWVEFDPQRKRISEAGQRELDNRYRTWYNKTTAQKPRRVEPTTGEIVDANPVNDVEFDNPFMVASNEEVEELEATGEDFYGEEWKERRADLAHAISKQRTRNPYELTPKEVARLIDGINKKMDAIRKAEMAAQPEGVS